MAMMTLMLVQFVRDGFFLVIVSWSFISEKAATILPLVMLTVILVELHLF
jgi:hypothetical protein